MPLQKKVMVSQFLQNVMSLVSEVMRYIKFSCNRGHSIALNFFSSFIMAQMLSNEKKSMCIQSLEILYMCVYIFLKVAYILQILVHTLK